MKILFFQWNAYMQKDIAYYLKKMKVDFKIISYNFRSVEQDAYFNVKFPKKLEEDHYDAVFSLNFLPFLADVCYKCGVKYISWTYDSPLDFKRISALRYPTNYAFFFDKLQYQRYVKRGFQNIYYLPLGVNTDRLDSMVISDEERERFSCDVSFVGKIYDTQLDQVFSALTDYQKGYLTAVCDAQLRVYGYNFLKEMLTDKLMNAINVQHIMSSGSVSSQLIKEQVFFAMCTSITHKERMEILGRLSRKYPVTLYSGGCPKELDKVDYRGTVTYDTEMPKVFRLSRINLNITLKCIESGIPLRALDILASGGFLMSNYQPELDEYFENGKEVVLYESIDDLLDKAEYYLNHEEERAAVAKRGHDRVHELFNYERQLREIFSVSGLEFQPSCYPKTHSPDL